MKKSIALIWLKSTFLETPMVWQPLGLMYIGAQLEAMGHRCEFFDLNVDEMPKDGDFDLLFVSSTSPQIQETRRIAQITDGWKTKRILGGAGSWANPEVHKEIPYDLVVSGESDHPINLQKVLDSIGTETRFLSFPEEKNLEWVLPPLRRWSHKYKAEMVDLLTGEKHTLSSTYNTRGCALSCAFCEVGRFGVIFGRTVRYEPLEIVERQYREIKDAGYSAIGMYDDIKPMNKRRMLQELEILKPLDMKWRCFLRSDIICKQGGKEYLRQMRDAGLIEIFVGIESADNKIKENIFKGTTIEQDEFVLQWCRELGITFKGSFIMGLPGESQESMNKTRDWILKQNPDGIRIQVGRLIPFAGTPLYDHPELFDLKYERQPDENWFYAGNNGYGTKSFVSTSHLNADKIDVFWRGLLKDMKQAGIKS